MVHDSQTTDLKPIISRSTLSELQEQAVKLNLPETVRELEGLRVVLAQEHKAPVRTDEEAATLAAQFNVARADYLARDKRLDNFEASVHLVNYEVGEERWSLAVLDKQIARRQEDTKIIPEFTDKEKINLEVYAERQTDSQERDRFLDLARERGHVQQREVFSRGR